MRATNDEEAADRITAPDPSVVAGDTGPAAPAQDHAGARGWRLGHNPALDGFRAVAVLLVIGVHSWPSKLPGGGIGVTMFFTLSGFLITALLLAEITDNGRLSFTNFYMRRVLRLFPALVVVVVIVYLYSRITGFDEARTSQAVAPALLYYANWARVAGADLGMFGHTWSLAVEEQFYLIWPVILWLAYRFRGLWAVLAVSVLGALASTLTRIVIQSNWTPTTGARLQNGFDTQAVGIFVGCAVATVLFLGWKPRRLIVYPVAIVTVWYVYGAVTNIFKAGAAGSGVAPLLVSIGFASVICWLDQWPRSAVARVLGLAPIAYVGRISYGLYLWHIPIKALVAQWGYKDSATTMLLVTALSLPVATASFFLVERPFLRLKDRFRSPARLAPQLATPG